MKMLYISFFGNSNTPKQEGGVSLPFNQKNIKLSKRYLWSFFAAVSIMGVAITLLLSVLYGSSQTQVTAKYSVA